MDRNSELDCFLIAGSNLNLIIFTENNHLSIDVPISLDPIYYSV
jgi:hypothetical protein